jgi:hypothetical protein
MSLAGSRFSSESAPRPLYGTFFVKEFARAATFFLRRFLDLISNSVSSFRPAHCWRRCAQKLSKLAVAPTLRYASPLPGHTSTASSTQQRPKQPTNAQIRRSSRSHSAASAAPAAAARFHTQDPGRPNSTSRARAPVTLPESVPAPATVA